MFGCRPGGCDRRDGCIPVPHVAGCDPHRLGRGVGLLLGMDLEDRRRSGRRRETRRHANIEDASRRTAEVIVLSAGVALLAAVGLVLIKAGQSHGGTKAYLITIGIVSVMLSWATIHTVFMLRYARTHYQSPGGAVDFNEEEPPRYLDFAYLAFTIGMTFQVSDTNLTTKPIRRIALSHALMSYLFGAVIIAIAINIVASLLS